MYVSRIISEISSVKERRDLESGGIGVVQGHCKCVVR